MAETGHCMCCDLGYGNAEVPTLSGLYIGLRVMRGDSDHGVIPITAAYYQSVPLYYCAVQVYFASLTT